MWEAMEVERRCRVALPGGAERAVGGSTTLLGKCFKSFRRLDHVPALTSVCVCVCVCAGCGVLCEAEGAKVGAVCGGVPTLDGTSLSHLHTAGKPAATPLPSTGRPQPHDPPRGLGLSGEGQGMGLWAGLGPWHRVIFMTVSVVKGLGIKTRVKVKKQIKGTIGLRAENL